MTSQVLRARSETALASFDAKTGEFLWRYKEVVKGPAQAFATFTGHIQPKKNQAFRIFLNYRCAPRGSAFAPHAPRTGRSTDSRTGRKR
jgi:hypothetical protein